ncbi:uncharacterized protein CMU_011530 [Cryptosporidium muris RN66]|uniref:GSKIP domain-containing protein n=1 Tax=Cryptosporidium muris (strain RN66) TaxID=441375 RepID=B6AJ12_CRYMR|nr:uncharacterized protein CMU_011530 [Cryptosporidium muris RN66]EEA08203.1 hypothetical protein CMU_011530 [Cryptosporidium muris RN66]|eukprot:XP_002142552.1 hypothetical protein [Cryptosporidium muris RN66]
MKELVNIVEVLKTDYTDIVKDVKIIQETHNYINLIAYIKRDDCIEKFVLTLDSRGFKILKGKLDNLEGEIYESIESLLQTITPNNWIKYIEDFLRKIVN